MHLVQWIMNELYSILVMGGGISLEPWFFFPPQHWARERKCPHEPYRKTNNRIRWWRKNKLSLGWQFSSILFCLLPFFVIFFCFVSAAANTRPAFHFFNVFSWLYLQHGRFHAGMTTQATAAITRSSRRPLYCSSSYTSWCLRTNRKTNLSTIIPKKGALYLPRGC